MATVTATLGLTLPIGTEKVSRAIINGNMQLIDSYAATTNQAIANLDTDTNSTNDILADALNCTKSKFFKGSGTAYTGTIPNSNYKYGVFHVDVRGTRKFVTGINTAGLAAVNAYDGSSWTGWQELALKSDLATKSVSMTNVNSKVSNTNNIGAYSSGNMLIYHGYFSLTGSITKDSEGIFSSTAPYGSKLPEGMLINASSGNVYAVYVKSNGGVFADGRDVPAGTYGIVLSYGI